MRRLTRPILLPPCVENGETGRVDCINKPGWRQCAMRTSNRLRLWLSITGKRDKVTFESRVYLIYGIYSHYDSIHYGGKLREIQTRVVWSSEII